MSPTSLLQYTISLITLYLLQHTLSQTQCLVVWVTIDSIDPSLSKADWEGTYSTDLSTTTNGCLIYTTSFGASLEYHPNAWGLHSNTNNIITYSTSTSSPCNPPLITTIWALGITGKTDPLITIECSYSSSPTYEPTQEPTYEPTFQPTTATPTYDPTMEPTVYPTEQPSNIPTIDPTNHPSTMPSPTPTKPPSIDPTNIPSIDPTAAPTMAPSMAPSTAPTTDCSRIVLRVWAKPDNQLPTSIDGIYYQQEFNYPGTNYPYYEQIVSGTNAQLPTNNAYIIFEQGYWTIIEARGNIKLKYREIDPDPTLHVPPHSPLVRDGWIDLKGPSQAPYDYWFIEMQCTYQTDAPTNDPTQEPTSVPTEDPTLEPTINPTEAEPTFFPTAEPIVTTYVAEDIDEGGKETDSFLDKFSIIEWIIIASIPIICCLIICSLYVWRNKEIQKAKDKEAAHNLSANLSSEDELEMTAKDKRNTQLDFGRHKRQSTADIEANFADALAVVSKHKSERSMNNNNDDNDDNNYKALDAQSPQTPPPVPNTTGTVPQSPQSATNAPLINKRESEFYGNHPIDEIYSYTFITKPFGMEWKTTKSDKKNLYVSKVQKDSQAALGNVQVGSKLISFNGEMIEDLGAKQIYGKLALSDMPLTVTFLKPFKKEQDKEGDNYAQKPPVQSPSALPPPVPKPELQQRDTTPPAPPAANVSGIPPNVVPAQYAADDNNNPLIPPKVPSIVYQDDVNAAQEDPFAGMDDGMDDAKDEEDDPFAEIDELPTILAVNNNDNADPREHKQPSIMTQAQALIPEVFADDDQVDEQESFHAD